MCEKLLIFNYKRAVTQSNPWSFTVLLFKDQIKNDKGAWKRPMLELEYMDTIFGGIKVFLQANVRESLRQNLAFTSWLNLLFFSPS